LRALVVVGATFRDASLATREGLAFPSGEIETHLARLKERPELREALILSTCNRVEVYAVAAQPGCAKGPLDAVREVWGEAVGLRAEQIQGRTETWVSREAVLHALRVIASLDSMVVGEAQILGQSKEAFRIARDAGTARADLSSLFQHAFKVAKQVRSQTAIGKESVSVSSVAVRLARDIFEPMNEVRVLLVGAGKMSELAARGLQDAGARSVTVINRTHSRARRVANARGWRARHFDDLDLLLPEVDVVITSTGSSRPVISPELVKETMRRRRYRPLFFIDIAVPRDVDPRVADVDRVFLYNVDDLEEIANRNLRHRQKDIEAAEAIVEAGVVALQRRRKINHRAPLLARLSQRASALRDHEVKRAVARLGADDEHAQKVIFEMAHHISQQLTRGAYGLVKGARDEELEELMAVLDEAYGLPPDPLSAAEPPVASAAEPPCEPEPKTEEQE